MCRKKRLNFVIICDIIIQIYKMKTAECYLGGSVDNKYSPLILYELILKVKKECQCIDQTGGNFYRS